MFRSLVRRRAMLACALASVCMAGLSAARAAEPKLDEMMQRGFEFLAQGQNEKGQISPRIGSGVTALAVTAGSL